MIGAKKKYVRAQKRERNYAVFLAWRDENSLKSADIVAIIQACDHQVTLQTVKDWRSGRTAVPDWVLVEVIATYKVNHAKANYSSSQ